MPVSKQNAPPHDLTNVQFLRMCTDYFLRYWFYLFGGRLVTRACVHDWNGLTWKWYGHVTISAQFVPASLCEKKKLNLKGRDQTTMHKHFNSKKQYIHTVYRVSILFHIKVVMLYGWFLSNWKVYCRFMVCQQNKQVPNDGLGQLRSRLITFLRRAANPNPYRCHRHQEVWQLWKDNYTTDFGPDYDGN